MKQTLPLTIEFMGYTLKAYMEDGYDGPQIDVEDEDGEWSASGNLIMTMGVLNNEYGEEKNAPAKLIQCVDLLQATADEINETQ